jgi:hypothetical protein
MKPLDAHLGYQGVPGQVVLAVCLGITYLTKAVLRSRCRWQSAHTPPTYLRQDTTPWRARFVIFEPLSFYTTVTGIQQQIHAKRRIPHSLCRQSHVPLPHSSI